MAKKRKSKKVKEYDPLDRDLSELMEKGKWFRFNELFELQPKDRTVTIRISQDLLNEIKKAAKDQDTDYQKLIRNILIEYVSKKVS